MQALNQSTHPTSLIFGSTGHRHCTAVECARVHFPSAQRKGRLSSLWTAGKALTLLASKTTKAVPIFAGIYEATAHPPEP